MFGRLLDPEQSLLSISITRSIYWRPVLAVFAMAYSTCIKSLLRSTRPSPDPQSNKSTWCLAVSITEKSQIALTNTMPHIYREFPLLKKLSIISNSTETPETKFLQKNYLRDFGRQDTQGSIGEHGYYWRVPKAYFT